MRILKDRFTDRIVIVTGACGGIGSATVKLFYEEKAEVVLADMDSSALEVMPEKLGLSRDRCLLVQTDVSKEEAVSALVEKTVSRFGKLDVMFNNAGVVGAVANIQDFPTQSMRHVMDINVMGVFFGTKYALKAMIPRKCGVIINASSVAGHRGMPQTVAYTASKHAIIGITRAAAAENARSGVRVCAVCPAPVNTQMMIGIENGMVSMGAGDKSAVYAEMAANLPMGRYATPEEVAKAVLFLASDDASYVNGSSLFVDGGFTA